MQDKLTLGMHKRLACMQTHTIWVQCLHRRHHTRRTGDTTHTLTASTWLAAACFGGKPALLVSTKAAALGAHAAALSAAKMPLTCLRTRPQAPALSTAPAACTAAAPTAQPHAVHACNQRETA